MADQYPPGGAIFKHSKKTPQSPNMDGYVEIDEEMLSDIAVEIQNSPERRAKLHLSLWTKESRKGDKFFSVKPRTETARQRELDRLDRRGGDRPAARPDPLDDEIPF